MTTTRTNTNLQKSFYYTNVVVALIRYHNVNTVYKYSAASKDTFQLHCYGEQQNSGLHCTIRMK